MDNPTKSDDRLNAPRLIRVNSQQTKRAQHPQTARIGTGTLRLHQHLDKAGAYASLACAVHCMFLPIILTFLPLTGLGILADHRVEEFILISAVALATVSLCWGYHVHGDRRTLYLLALAMVLFTAAHELVVGDTVHGLVMASGGLALAVGHITNLRLCRSCRDCREH